MGIKGNTFGTLLEHFWIKGNTLALLVGMQIDTATVEDGMEIP